MLAVMGKLDYGNRITARTSPDVRESVTNVVARYARMGVKFRGRKFGVEGLMGPILLDFLTKTDEEQDAIVLGRLDEYEAALAEMDDAATAAPHPPTTGLPKRLSATKRQSQRKRG